MWQCLAANTSICCAVAWQLCGQTSRYLEGGAAIINTRDCKHCMEARALRQRAGLMGRGCVWVQRRQRRGQRGRRHGCCAGGVRGGLRGGVHRLRPLCLHQEPAPAAAGRPALAPLPAAAPDARLPAQDPGAWPLPTPLTGLSQQSCRVLHSCAVLGCSVLDLPTSCFA
jgi:hypothetical protein